MCMNQRTYAFAALPLILLLQACGEPSGPGKTGTAATETVAVEPVRIKETGRGEGLDFTVTAVEQRGQIGPAGVGPKAEASETFVVVSYTLKNTSGKALPFLERPGLSLVDGKGQTYAPDDIAGIMAAGMMNDPSGMSADLNPNVSAKTKAVWKLDKAAFDRATWRLNVATDPQLAFSLK